MSIHDSPHSVLLQKTATAHQINNPSWTQFTLPRGDWSNALWDAKKLGVVGVTASKELGLHTRVGSDIELEFRDRATVPLPSPNEPRIVTAAYRKFPPLNPTSWRGDVIILSLIHISEPTRPY